MRMSGQKKTGFKEKDRLKVIQKRYSAIMYLLAFSSLFYPWMVIGGKRYSLCSFVLLWRREGINEVLKRAGVPRDISYDGGFGVFFVLLLIYILLSVFYFATMLLEKNWNVNYGAVLMSVAVAVSSTEQYMPGRLCENIIESTMFPFIFLFFSGFECVGRKMIEIWEETLKKTLAYREKERREKAERKRRLAFPGKYSRLFYEAIWKNFRKNLKDYAMLFVCNALVFAVVFSGFGLQQVIKEGDVSLQIGYPVGAGKILLDSLSELGAVGLFMLVLLLLYYLKRRIPEYGMFSTLGIRRRTMYFCMGAELVLGGLLSLLAGGILGGVLVTFLKGKLSDGGDGWLSPVIILASAGVIVLFYLVTFCVTHDLFVGLRMGNSTDLGAVGEKLPKKRQIFFAAAGLIIAVSRLKAYAENRNYENIDLLIVCFLGIYFVLRYGMAWILTRKKKQGKYLNNLFGLHSFYHRSRSAVWYMFGLCVIQSCILGLFPVQIFSAGLIGDADDLSPYALVCLGGEGEEDAAFIRSLREMNDTRVETYPMVRVIGNKAEQPGRLVTPDVCSQNIGIPESAYHELKARQDPRYKKKDLGYDKNGGGIYIVHQQDKGTKARPVDYGRNDFYVGTVYEYAQGFDEWGENELSDPYRITGQETSALTGIMCQGERENIIVFSDAYFEKVKQSVEKLEYPGPTLLILADMDDKALKASAPLLKAFRERHSIDEKYDAKVKSYYLKEDAQKRFHAELSMRTVMGELLIPLFFLAGVLLWKIRLMTEHGPNKRRTEFLNCMGMRKKERTALLRRELRVYYLTLLAVSVLVGGSIVFGTFQARFYERAEQIFLLRRIVPFGVCELLEFGLVMKLMTEREISRLEKEV